MKFQEAVELLAEKGGTIRRPHWALREKLRLGPADRNPDDDRAAGWHQLVWDDDGKPFHMFDGNMLAVDWDWLPPGADEVPPGADFELAFRWLKAGETIRRRAWEKGQTVSWLKRSGLVVFDGFGDNIPAGLGTYDIVANDWEKAG